MTNVWRRIASEVGPSFAAALGLSGGFLVFVAWDQSHWWRTKEDYGFGWIVPLLVGFVIYDRWNKIREVTGVCADPRAVRVTGARKWLLRILIVSTLIGGVLLFLLGAFYRAGAGPSHPGTLAITMGAAAIILPLLFLNAPAGAVKPDEAGARKVGLFEDPRVRLTGLFLFPVLVWLVSAPMVSLVENQLSLFLLGKVVAVVSFVFEMLGLPLEQQGNVLLLPSGSVGVEDACSGIRSFTACLFAGSFLAAVFVTRWWKKIALVTAAMALAFLTNLVRALFLTAWAYRHGPEAISGTVHHIAGYSVLGLTVAGLMCLLPLLNLGSAGAAEEELAQADLRPRPIEPRP